MVEKPVACGSSKIAKVMCKFLVLATPWSFGWKGIKDASSGTRVFRR